MSAAEFDAVAAARALNDELERKMSQSQQILGSWVQKKQSSSDELLNNHRQNMLNFSAAADQHQVHLSSLIVEKRRVTVEKEKENLEGNTLQTDVSAIKSKKSELENEIATIQNTQREQAAILEAKQAEIEHLTKTNTGIVAELQKSLSFYRKFGLNFERFDDRQLKLTFTLVDPHDHTRPFSFFLLINSHDQYEVEGCSPPVAALPEMLATLNATNDFSAFVVGMRQQFKAMV